MIESYIENINEGEIVENWEAQGWNIKKFDNLVYNSNPTALEFLSGSEISYYKDKNIKIHLKIQENMPLKMQI